MLHSLSSSSSSLSGLPALDGTALAAPPLPSSFIFFSFPWKHQQIKQNQYQMKTNDNYLCIYKIYETQIWYITHIDVDLLDNTRAHAGNKNNYVRKYICTYTVYMCCTCICTYTVYMCCTCTFTVYMCCTCTCTYTVYMCCTCTFTVYMCCTCTCTYTVYMCCTCTYTVQVHVLYMYMYIAMRFVD